VEAIGPWKIFWLIVALLLGPCIGSFLNVCIYRLPRGMSLWWPPSSCPRCLQRIRWYDNIPLLSYLLLNGRCRFCGQLISIRYFLVEALTTAAWVLSWWRHIWNPLGSSPDGLAFLSYALLFSGLIAVSFIDWDWYVVPDSLTVPLMGLGLVANCLSSSITLVEGFSLVPRWNSWGPGQRWGVVALLAVGIGSAVMWGRALWKRRNAFGLVGPADWILWGAFVTLVAYFAAVIWAAQLWNEIPVWMVRLGEQRGFWASILGMTLGVAPVWSVRVAGNGFLRWKRRLLAWRAWQWRELHPQDPRRGLHRPRLLRSEVPSNRHLYRVVFFGVRSIQRWIPAARWVAREAMGFGDVTLLAAIGAVVGWQAVMVAFFLAPCLALPANLVRFFVHGQREIPFGPFLSMSTVLVVLAWDWVWPFLQVRAELFLELLRLGSP
jgi:prepilin signal peptidase PulO-like enzyme (type II secretory pathway)